MNQLKFTRIVHPDNSMPTIQGWTIQKSNVLKVTSVRVVVDDSPAGVHYYKQGRLSARSGHLIVTGL